LRLDRNIQGRDGFVGYDQLGAQGQGARHANALALAAAKGVGMHRAIAGLAAAGYNLIANYALLNAPWKHEAAAIFDDTGGTPKALHVRQRFEQHVAFIDQVLHDLRFDGLKKALKMIFLDVDLMFFRRIFAAGIIVSILRQGLHRDV